MLPALRVAISVVTPLVVLTGAGRIDLSIYALFGAMASAYGRAGTHVDRLVMQAQAGVFLVGCTVLGTIVSALDRSAWLAIVAVGLVAAAASALSDRCVWRPAGALFPVFAAGACASVPAAWADVSVALAVACLSALLAVGVGAVGFTSHRTRRVGRTSLAGRTRAPIARGRAVEHAVAASGALALAAGLGLAHAYWAAVAAVVPLALPDAAGGLKRAWNRLFGTAGGLAVAAVLFAFQPREVAVIGLVAMLQIGAELFVLRQYGVAMLFVTPMALLMTSMSVGTTSGLVVDRAITTACGIAVGAAVVAVFHDRSSGW